MTELEEIILYSTGCPQCTVLEKKLERKGIAYTKNMNTDEMKALGINVVPVLSVNGELKAFAEAVNWVNGR